MGITVGKSYDRNAAEFFNATQVLTTLQKEAVNQLVVDLKSYGIWNKMKVVYPMVGQAGVSSSFSYNLKDINTFRGIFFGSWIFSSTGIKSNATNAYMDSALNASTELNINSTHLSYYARNLNTSAGLNILMGNGQATCFLQGGFNVQIGSNLASNAGSYYNETPVGFLLSNKQNSTTQQNYKNNTSQSFTVTTTAFATTSQNIFIGNYDESSTFSSNSECAFSSIGDGLTNTDAINLYNIVQKYQTTLGRQV